MSDRYLDDYSPAIAIDIVLEEKTRIAKMAAATLHKLHNAVQQMRDWQNDSAKLKSNIWRMKMALHADDKNENDNQQIDPLIVHQRAEISRLEQVNDALENEVASLKRALTTAEEDIERITACEMGDKIARIKDEFSNEKESLNDEISCLRKKLKEVEEGVMLKQLRDKLNEFVRSDRTIEMVFANVIGKVAETVVDLSEKLVDVSEDLYRFKTRNENLHVKLDRLKAMLRSRSGSSARYRKRIKELNDLAEQLKSEMDRLKVIRGNMNCGESLDATDIPDVVRHVESLMNDLKNNLRNDREAMIAAGDPDYLKYMKKVVDIKISLKVMSVELRRSNISIDKRSCGDVAYERYLKTASLLNDFLNEIDIEINKLKVRSMDKYCRIGGINTTQYTTKIVELEKIVKKSAVAIAVLKQTPSEITSINDNVIVEFEELIERLCYKIKNLDIFDDRLNLCERIEHLETLTISLRLELMEKDDCINVLKKESTNIRTLLERNHEELKTTEKIIANVREENESFREDLKNKEQEILNLSRRCEHSDEYITEMQLMKVEINAEKKKLQNLHYDKEKLLEETVKMRYILQDKDKEIVNIVTQRDTKIGILRGEIKDVKMKLWIASDENAKLKNIIEEFEKQQEHERLDKLKSSKNESGGDDGDNSEYSQDYARNLQNELGRWKVESNESKINLNEVNKRIECLKCTLDKTMSDRTKLENEISSLKSNEESLTYRLNVQKSTDEKLLREFERVTAENKALESKFKHLRNEKEQLKAELSELRSEKGLLDRSIADANNKCTTLQDQVNKFKSERNSLQQKISEHEAATENLKFKLERVETELVETADKIEGLKSENSKLTGNVEVLSLRNIETENCVQVLLTEKNELLTRINEFNEDTIALRDQLNKAETENGYFSMELNKSKAENDQLKARNALLQVTCDKRQRDNRELKRERDDARKRSNEFNSENRILDNQLKILQIKYSTLRFAAAALCRKNSDHKDYSKKTDARYPLLKGLEQVLTDPCNEIERKQDYPDAACSSIKIEIDELKDDETEFKVESDTCASHDNKAKIKDKSKGELKRLRIENKALKLELANLRSENSEVTMELASTKDEFERAITQAEGSKDDESIGSILNKLEVVNICCKKEMNNYSSYFNGSMRTVGNKQATAVVTIDQLQVENTALKKEMDILRDSLNFNLMDGERTKIEFDRAIEEIQALKLELMNLRDEKVALRSQLETLKEELNGLKSERIALKDELAASRKSNFDLRLKANDLRCANEKLKETNVGLENHLQDTLRAVNKCTATSEGPYKNTRNDFENTLNNKTQEHTFKKENLRKINKRLHKSEHISAISKWQSVKGNL